MSPASKIGQTFDESQEPGLTNQINSSIEKGAEKLEIFERGAKKLISTLKQQHGTMIAFNDARLETAKMFETFVANTPITKAMGEIDTEKDKEAVFKKQSVSKQSSGTSNSSVASSKTSTASVKNTNKTGDAPSAAQDSVPAKSKAETMPAEDDEITVDTALMIVASQDGDEMYESMDATSYAFKSSFISEEDPPVNANVGNEEDAPVTTPFEKQVIKGSEYSQVDISNFSVAQASHKLTLTYAEQYQSSIIDYAEEWLQVVTTRIQSRLIEFDKLRDSLNHYVTKVSELRVEARKLESHGKTISPKKSEKLERNELKLNGAREAHHTYGQSLYLLIDEVTARGWRDLFPLIVNSVHFDLNYSSDQAKLYSKLEAISDMLDEVAAADPLGLDIDGRLEQLKKAAPEEVYTGKEYSRVHPVLKAI